MGRRFDNEQFHQSSVVRQYLGAVERTPFALSCFGGLLKPMRKPSEIPVRKNCTSAWLGWPDRRESQLFAFKGVVIAAASCGTLILVGEFER